MRTFFIIVFALILFVVLVIFLDIALGYFLALYNHKCPFCGKRMTFMHRKYNDNKELESYIFNCPNCGAWDNLHVKDFLRKWEEADTK